VLLRNAGQLVHKEELMRELWPDTIVEEVGLARNIWVLRKALGGEGTSRSSRRSRSGATASSHGCR
jgi:DNA-binding winged helix-turn-helix (wHTH) protein